MKILFLLLLSIMSSSVFSKTVARVINISGNAFLFSSEVKAMQLSYGSKVEDLSEVMVEDGSTLSLVNDLGHIIHVNGGSLVKFYKGITELKNGYVWVKVRNNSNKGSLNTTNSIVRYNQGQFIYSFDNLTGKTQLLVLSGDVELSNVVESQLKVKVASGHFSLIDQSYNNGLPRAPTKIGLDSYKSLKGVFANFKNLENSKFDKMLGIKNKTNRKIASVNDQFSSTSINTSTSDNNIKPGKLITIKTYGKPFRLPASSSPMEYYKSLTKVKKTRLKQIKKAKIHYFGFNGARTVSKAKKYKKLREPASIKPSGKSQLLKELNSPGEFEKSLMKKAMENKRHSEEVNNLIDDLNSYKKDYQKNY